MIDDSANLEEHPMIDWSSFSWEALATLVTGVTAVAGAIYIGRRQVVISDRQSRILEQQVRLDRLRLRSELFERRFEVYEATSRFLGAILAHADKPEQDIERRFLVAMDASRFLFMPQVRDDLDDIWRQSCAYFATKGVMAGNYRRDGHYGEGMPQKELEQVTALHDRFSNLSVIFGDELRLSDVALVD